MQGSTRMEKWKWQSLETCLRWLLAVHLATTDSMLVTGRGTQPCEPRPCCSPWPCRTPRCMPGCSLLPLVILTVCTKPGTHHPKKPPAPAHLWFWSRHISLGHPEGLTQGRERGNSQILQLLVHEWGWTTARPVQSLCREQSWSGVRTARVAGLHPHPKTSSKSPRLPSLSRVLLGWVSNTCWRKGISLGDS